MRDWQAARLFCLLYGREGRTAQCTRLKQEAPRINRDEP